MNQAEVTRCREIFETFDTTGSGMVDMWRIREILQAIGLEPTDEELFTMIADADVNSDGLLTFQELLRIIQHQRTRGSGSDDDQDVLSAWHALGGAYDKSGKISLSALKAIVTLFDMQINLDSIIRAQIERRLSASLTVQTKKIVIPEDLDYDDFKALLAESKPELTLPIGKS